MKERVHNFFTLFIMILPPALFFGQWGGEALMTPLQRAWMMRENGPHEIFEFLTLVFAAGVALTTLCRMNRRTDPLLTFWVALALLCCIYVGGEEISWGQWIFHWSTPDTWLEINDQHETNLHNTSAWLDQKPRLILEIGIIIGGILLPALRAIKPQALPARFALFYPTNSLVPMALCAEAIKILQSSCNGLGTCMPFFRSSEVQELFFFLFVLFYLLILQSKIKMRDQTSPTSNSEAG